MKSVLRSLTFLAIIVFIGLIFVVLYYVYFIFPDKIIEAAELRDTVKIDLVKHQVMPLLMMVGIELAIGLFVIVLLSITNRFGSAENVVYVEKYIDRSKQERNVDAETERGTSYQEKAEDLKRRIRDKDTPQEKLNCAISELCTQLQASIGAIFLSTESEGNRYIEFVAGYAYQLPDSKRLRFEYGEGIAGQVAREGKEININAVPRGYITVLSGLGHASPGYMAVMPIKSDDKILGVIEIASFTPFGEIEMAFIRDVAGFLSMQLAFDPMLTGELES